jgi:hypothetical protein
VKGYEEKAKYAMQMIMHALTTIVQYQSGNTFWKK